MPRSMPRSLLPCSQWRADVQDHGLSRANIPLPTARATPAGVSTENRAAPIQLPASFEVESGLPETIEAKTNNETEIDTDIVIRGQSPESGITSDGAPPPPGKIRPVQYTEDAIPGVTGAIGKRIFRFEFTSGSGREPTPSLLLLSASDAPVLVNPVSDPSDSNQLGKGQSDQRSHPHSRSDREPATNRSVTPRHLEILRQAPSEHIRRRRRPRATSVETPGGYGSQGGFPHSNWR